MLKTDEIYLVNPKVEQYVHTAAYPLAMQHELREVNASQALRTRLKIVSFAEHDPKAHKYLNGGDIIRLYHPESDTCVCAGNVNKAGQRTVQYLGFYGNDDIEKTSSNGLWVVEKDQVDQGGPCEYVQMGMPSSFRFRNVATNKYLSGRLPDVNFMLDEEDEEGAEEEEGGVENVNVGDMDVGLKWELAVEDNTREDSSLFSLETTSFSASNNIEANAPVTVQHVRSTRFIHAGEAVQNKQAGLLQTLNKQPLARPNKQEGLLPTLNPTSLTPWLPPNPNLKPSLTPTPKPQ